MQDIQPSSTGLIKVVLIRIFIFIVGSCLVFFLPAGTFAYWEAWVYLGITLSAMSFILVYLFKNDVELLQRRMKMKEQEPQQKFLIKISWFHFLFTFLIPGFDHRFGWSQVHTVVILCAEIILVIAYGIIFLTFRENRYASRIIEVVPGQQVISSGPYAIVRHPMYVGVIITTIVGPLALGSYWAMISALLVIPIIRYRILNEERVLIKGLAGYSEYTKNVRYRLIPGIW